MPTFHIYLNGTFQGIIRAVSLRQAQARARTRYGRRVDVIGGICEGERLSPRSARSQSRVGPAVL
jgi:hypothetical protein